ncbi:MAG: 2-dehydropantoate 2-reductase [Dehalococcoidia bacterium]
MSKRTAIIGAGAIGGVVGGLVSKAGYDVTLVDQWPEHVDAIKKNGLLVSTRTGEHQTSPKALHIHELQGVSEPFDMAFVAVKSYDTEWATTLMLRYVKPDGVFVDFQNGINDERVAAIAGKERTLGCVITISSGCYEPGKVVRTDTNTHGFKIGEQDGSDTPRARELVDMINNVAETSLTTNLWGERWSKLMVNCMNNAQAGLTGYGTAEVRTRPDTMRIGIQIAAEVVRVGRAHGKTLGSVMGLSPDAIVDAAEGRNIEDVEMALMETARHAGSEGRPSFLQDVMKCRRTEIDFLNGYVSEFGRKAGVPTPFCDKITEIVNGLGVGFKSDPRHIQPLIEMLP